MFAMSQHSVLPSLPGAVPVGTAQGEGGNVM